MATGLEILGKNIAAARGRQGLNQAQFAKLMGVSNATASQWESGKIDLNYKRLCQIAERLKTSPAALSDPSVPARDDIDKKRLDAIAAIASAGTPEFLGVWSSLSAIVGTLESKKEQLGG